MILRVEPICADGVRNQFLPLGIKSFGNIRSGNVAFLTDFRAAPEEVLVADIRSILLFHDAHATTQSVVRELARMLSTVGRELSDFDQSMGGVPFINMRTAF